jgi:hypothetical protein
MRSNILTRLCLGLAFSSLLLTSCEKLADTPVPEIPQVIKDKDATFYALVGGKQLAKFSLLTFKTARSTVTIDGLESGEVLLGIDFRPATGQLYGVGSTSRLYVINPETGKARALGAGPFAPVLSGTMVGFDFNPTVDRIRLVTSSGQNLRLNPETGTVTAIDGPINGGSSPMITGAAYTNNTSGASTTVLYDIDVNTDKLYKQDPPNNGTLVEVGSLGVDLKGNGGFDIAPDGIVALAAYDDKLYYVNVDNGMAVSLGSLGGLTNITGLAIKTDPVAYTTLNGSLLIFNPMTGVIAPKGLTGMAPGETVLGIDFRPATSQLYALGSTSRLYTINLGTGLATAVGAAPFTPALTGTSFAFDFNPTVDRIRIVSNTGQNLRVHPETGMVAFVDGPVMMAGASVVHAAYTNNFAGATTTMLYDIDITGNRLFMQNPPNDGILAPVGSLGLTLTSAAGGFDIGGATNTGYALLTTAAGSRVYTINLATGAATQYAPFLTATNGFAIGLGF